MLPVEADGKLLAFMLYLGKRQLCLYLGTSLVHKADFFGYILWDRNDTVVYPPRSWL